MIIKLSLALVFLVSVAINVGAVSAQSNDTSNDITTSNRTLTGLNTGETTTAFNITDALITGSNVTSATSDANVTSATSDANVTSYTSSGSVLTTSVSTETYSSTSTSNTTSSNSTLTMSETVGTTAYSITSTAADTSADTTAATFPNTNVSEPTSLTHLPSLTETAISPTTAASSTTTATELLTTTGNVSDGNTTSTVPEPLTTTYSESTSTAAPSSLTAAASTSPTLISTTPAVISTTSAATTTSTTWTTATAAVALFVEVVGASVEDTIAQLSASFGLEAGSVSKLRPVTAEEASTYFNKSEAACAIVCAMVSFSGSKATNTASALLASSPLDLASYGLAAVSAVATTAAPFTGGGAASSNKTTIIVIAVVVPVAVLLLGLVLFLLLRSKSKRSAYEEEDGSTQVSFGTTSQFYGSGQAGGKSSDALRLTDIEIVANGPIMLKERGQSVREKESDKNDKWSEVDLRSVTSSSAHETDTNEDSTRPRPRKGTVRDPTMREGSPLQVRSTRSSISGPPQLPTTRKDVTETGIVPSLEDSNRSGFSVDSEPKF